MGGGVRVAKKERPTERATEREREREREIEQERNNYTEAQYHKGTHTHVATLASLASLRWHVAILASLPQPPDLSRLSITFGDGLMGGRMGGWVGGG